MGGWKSQPAARSCVACLGTTVCQIIMPGWLNPGPGTSVQMPMWKLAGAICGGILLIPLAIGAPPVNVGHRPAVAAFPIVGHDPLSAIH